MLEHIGTYVISVFTGVLKVGIHSLLYIFAVGVGRREKTPPPSGTRIRNGIVYSVTNGDRVTEP